MLYYNDKWLSKDFIKTSNTLNKMNDNATE